MTEEIDAKRPSRRFVPVCAIGASAGGVTALQSLFRLLPTDLGLAYVVILHLSPDQPSALTEVLASCTRMPVHQVEDGPTLEADCVYVIPPNRELVIEGDSVTARPFSEPRGHRAPIDLFFRSIAAARGDGVAIVLSGAGSDGALGVAAIKEAGGVIMVQEPAEAGFASMPQNAIASGAADFVAPIARLAERLAEVAHSKEAVRSLDMDGAANDLRRIVALLRSRTGHDFSAYKRATVMRRVLRRMQVCLTDTLADYGDYLLTTPEEAQNLFSDLLISVTMFFRDEHAFQALARQTIKPLFDMVSMDTERNIRVWVVGCATGEEAYSVAILLHEEAARHAMKTPFQIFATDLDEGALATAREGRYPRAIQADVSEARLARFFVDEGSHFRVRKELRESVLFAKHSVLKEPPFMRLDLITCRNLLIYLERALQGQVCSIFHYGLKPGRALFLGSAETADVAADLFTPIDRQARIYSARANAGHFLPILPQFAAPDQIAAIGRSVAPVAGRPASPGSFHVAALEQSAPASALVDEAMQILHLSPSAGRFILHSAGPVSSSLPAVVRPELRIDLRLALARALDQREPTITLPTAVAFEQERRHICMHVTTVNNDAQGTANALVFFLDGGPVPDNGDSEALPDSRPDEVRRLHAELKASQEALLLSRTGHDALIQELRAANEELQSINEEYRSTAEELETSKEELQSINEELHTVNAELKSKLETLSAAHSDLQNLSAATEIGTLFLDRESHIKMFTPSVATLFNITQHDVGRAITDFTHQLDYDGIDADAKLVLETLVPIAHEVRSRDGQSFFMSLRPYRTVDDRIDGTVITFVDVSERAEAEAALRESEARYRTLFESIDEGFLEVEIAMSPDGRATGWRYLAMNPSFERLGGLADITGKPMGEIVTDPDPAWAGRYAQVVNTGQAIRFELAAEDLKSWFDVYVARIGGAGSRRVAVVYSNATERKRAEAARQKSEERQRFLLALSDALTPLEDVDEIERAATSLLADALGAQRAFFASILADGDTGVIRSDFGSGIASVPSRLCLSAFGPARAAAWHAGQVSITADVTGDALATEAERAAYAAISARAAIIVPLVKRGSLVAILAVSAVVPREWTEAETVLVSATAHRIWDASQRAIAEATLRQSEERLQQFGEASQDVLWVRDAHSFQWEYLTPAFETIYGLDRQAALRGDNMAGWLELILPEDRDHAAASLRRVHDGEWVTFDYRIRRPVDGGIRWLRDTDFPIRDKSGKITRIGGIGHDVTLLKEAVEAVLAAENRQRALVEGMAQLAWRGVDGGGWTWASPQWTAFTGQAEADSHGYGWLQQVHPDDRNSIGALWKEAISLGAFQAEYRLREAATGRYRWFQTRAMPVRGDGDAILEWLGTSTDIEDLRSLQARQQVLVSELQHRTFNLMGLVSSMADATMRSSAGLADFESKFRDRIDSLARAQRLMSRLNEGDRITFDEMLRSELNAAGALPQDGGNVTLDGPEGVALRSRSVQTLAMAIHELTTNALKYGALKQPGARLDVRWRVEDGSDDRPWLHVDWRETGVVMPPPGDVPRGTGQGRTLIEGALPYQLGAQTSYVLAEDGVRCSISLPVSRQALAGRSDAFS